MDLLDLIFFSGILFTAAWLCVRFLGFCGGLLISLYKLNSVCWKAIGDKQCGFLSCPAQAHQLWSQTHILQGRRWKIFMGSEIQFERTFWRPRAFKLGQNPSPVCHGTLKLDWPWSGSRGQTENSFLLSRLPAETIQSVLARLQGCDLWTNHKPGICNLSSWSSNCLKHYGKKRPLFPREENLGAINNVQHFCSY